MTVDALLEGSVPPAVAALPDGKPVTDVARAATEAGWRVVLLDGRRASSGAEFLELAAEAFGLPSWYGHNWDALADCLGDLSWLPADRWLVLWDHVDVLEHGDPRAVQVALDVLDEAVEEWAERGRSFAALLRPAPDGLARG